MSSRAHSSHPSAHYNEYGEPLGGGVEPEVRAGPSRAKTCLRYLGAVCGFLFSHIGPLSLVVGYCIMGAFIFEADMVALAPEVYAMFYPPSWVADMVASATLVT